MKIKMSEKVIRKLLSHHHIKYHHQDEADGETDSAEIGVLALVGFRNQFLDNDVEHGSGGKGKHVRQNGCHERGQQHYCQTAEGFDGTAQ